MVCSVDTNQPFFLHLLLSLSNGQINKVTFVAGIEYIHGSATWTSTHQGQPGYSHCTISNFPITEINAESNVASFLVMISRLPGNNLITLDYFNIRMGTVLFFLE